MTEVNSYHQLMELAGKSKKAYLLLWKRGSDLSESALRNVSEASREQTEVQVFTADVSQVRDIHPAFGITSVPALLELSEGTLTNVIKGSHDAAFYKALLDDAFFRIMPADDSKPAKSVTVYTTPTCSWCNALKSWLRKNRISFREVDVSRDERMAQELVRKSGQMGVPQTEIDGQIVVGFNQARLKELLGITAQ
jgi:glutaredoxin-like YruB-family protein